MKCPKNGLWETSTLAGPVIADNPTFREVRALDSCGASSHFEMPGRKLLLRVLGEDGLDSMPQLVA